MLCQSCLNNNATTHIQTVVNGEAKELMLCSECAEKLGYNNLFANLSFGIGDLFKGFLGGNLQNTENTVRCPKCGLSFDDIISMGKVGCPDCYDIFYDNMLPVIEKIHGNTNHIGKKMLQDKKCLNVFEKIKSLEAKLKSLVENQEFEKAAEVRDKIKELKERGESNE